MTIGGYAFNTAVPGTGFGIAYIKGISDDCGVQRWEEVKGRTVQVIMTGARVLAEVGVETGRQVATAADVGQVDKSGHP